MSGYNHFTLSKLEFILRKLFVTTVVLLLGCCSAENLCKGYLDKGKFDDAVAECSKQIAGNNKYAADLAHSYLFRGIAYMNKGNQELALADYNKAIELDSKDAKTYNNRGNLYSDTGKRELALADYNKAIELDPTFAKTYNNRGLLYAEMGKAELALADYKKANVLLQQRNSP